MEFTAFLFFLAGHHHSGYLSFAGNGEFEVPGIDLCSGEVKG